MRSGKFFRHSAGPETGISPQAFNTGRQIVILDKTDMTSRKGKSDRAVGGLLFPRRRIRLVSFIITAFSILLFLQLAVSAQEKCLTAGRVDELKKLLAAAPEQPLNESLNGELVKLGTEFLDAGRAARTADDKKPDEKQNALVARARTRICQQLNTGGWPVVPIVKREGANAFMYLVSKALPIQTQLEIYPVVAEAFRRDLLERDEFLASYIDRLQLAVGARQLFGSQAYIRDGFLVLAPIDNITRVDERRKEFKMEPLRSYERFLEASYKMPLIRSVTEPANPDNDKKPETARPAAQQPAAALLGDEGEDVIKVSTALVTLDVVVSEPSASSTPLAQSDFRIFENDKPAEIESFARADSPFDIVLLLDLSGSTAEKAGLIKKSTRRFIEVKRPVDRVAVVTFSDTQTIVSELESDKEKLLARIKDLDGGGGSLVWDSIKFAQNMLEKGSSEGRRKAIVVMTDGLDNSLTFIVRSGSKISFADLAEGVQRSTVSIFPIFLDTTAQNSGYFARHSFDDAKRTLTFLADQSAGKLYTARKLEDLSDIYDRVMKDVGTVYTLGFASRDDTRDGQWRRIRVEVPSRPGIRLHHRPGYFPR